MTIGQFNDTYRPEGSKDFISAELRFQKYSFISLTIIGKISDNRLVKELAPNYFPVKRNFDKLQGLVN